ncbi:hypothetical protein [Aureispira anguillae]|uniref:Uncharacterized protein n=1 Tax=Aureispira anguillae TaxID=2864201 RepID=A0A915YM02_9BACT|nr:hypothetical protein [Aureispira anguillae]BDS15228.1 hypothetical protein AsAng_0060120 [Aureispira anguillae]
MKTLFFSFFITLFFSASLSAQCKNCYQTITVQHLSSSTGVQGCVSASLIVNYTLNGAQYSVLGNAVVIDPGSSSNIGALLPPGAVLVNKVVRFSTSGNDFFNHTAGSYNQVFCNGNNTQLCDPSSGGTKQLFIQSTSSSLVTFHINQIGTGGC